MAMIEVKVPQLSESVSEATLLQWKKKPGEAVAHRRNPDRNRDRQGRARSAGAVRRRARASHQERRRHRHRRRSDRQDRHRRQEAARGASRPQLPPRPQPAPAAAARRGARGRGRCRRRPQRRRCRPPPSSWPRRPVAPATVPGTGRDGRVTKGDVLEALAARTAAKAPRRRRAAHRCAAPAPRRPQRGRWPRRQVAAGRVAPPMADLATARNNACRCPRCARVSPSVCCSRSRPTPS